MKIQISKEQKLFFLSSVAGIRRTGHKIQFLKTFFSLKCNYQNYESVIIDNTEQEHYISNVMHLLNVWNSIEDNSEKKWQQ